jgi:DNA processing protein
MDYAEEKYLIALHSIPGMGHRSIELLFQYFSGYRCAWEKVNCWASVPNFAQGRIEQLIDGWKHTDIEQVFAAFQKTGAHVLTINDAGYPQWLKNIFDPPYIIYYRGELPADDDICIAMVGSRKASAYGRHVADKIARGLAQKGAWVVSGLARGIDTYSHLGSLGGGGKTIAVLGSGIDVIYPRENNSLYHQICDSGTVITELPIGSPPLARHFPARNRIISGLCRGVAVVEAAEKSGSLITVDYALEQGRDVFAVPGPVTSLLSRGTHKLIKQGAKLIETADDILEEYLSVDCVNNNQIDLFSFSQKEREILELMMTGQMHFDILVQNSGFSPSQMAALLTMWEIKGLIKQLPGKYYIMGRVDSTKGEFRD